MPIAVIAVLEIINIDYHQGKRAPVALFAFNLGQEESGGSSGGYRAR